MHITPEAAAAIHSLVSDRDGGGLRMFIAKPKDDGSRLDIGLVVTSYPVPGDEVIIAEHGSQVFVEQELSLVLADKTLDVADPGDDQRVAFQLVS